LTLKDVNDETPKFSSKSYTMEVNEDLSGLTSTTPDEYELLTVAASDDDNSDEFGSKSLV